MSKREAQFGKGWLEGPLTQAEVEQLVGPCWVPVRRFAVWQNGKWRFIDDASENDTNSTVSSPEKVDLGGVDEIVAAAACWCRAIDGDVVRIPTKDGLLGGRLSPEWSLPVRLGGRTADLKAAHKQLGKRAAHRLGR